MTRFYFHSDGRSPLYDRDGTELVGERAARVQATLLLGELLKERAEQLADAGGWSLDVTVADRAGDVSFALTAWTDGQRPK